MKTLSAKEIQLALKRKTETKQDKEQPDFTYAEPEERLEPATMPGGQQ